MENNYFGNKIKELRIKKGLSQADMAKKIGMQSPQLSKYENGEHTPSLEKVIKIAKVLGVSVGYLVGESVAEMPEIPNNHELHVIVSLAAGLDKSRRRKLLADALELTQASEQNEKEIS